MKEPTKEKTLSPVEYKRRYTLDIDADLLGEVTVLAKKNRRSVPQEIAWALTEYVRRHTGGKDDE